MVEPYSYLHGLSVFYFIRRRLMYLHGRMDPGPQSQYWLRPDSKWSLPPTSHRALTASLSQSLSWVIEGMMVPTAATNHRSSKQDNLFLRLPESSALRQSSPVLFSWCWSVHWQFEEGLEKGKPSLNHGLPFLQRKICAICCIHYSVCGTVRASTMLNKLAL